MSGPFYGSLAASASVFVAILTALLVNNYVRIKSDRRQTKKELNRVEEELDGLQDRKEDYKEIIDPLIEKRESDYREKAEEQVDEFIESDIFWELIDLDKPIEKLTVDELYEELLEFHDCESPEELEEEPVKYRHRDVLKDRLDEIEDRILDNIIPSFASDYEGEGWESDYSSDFKSRVEEIREEKEAGKDEEGSEYAEDEDTEEEPDIEAKAESGDSDVLELGDFLEEYREEYGLDDLDEKTVDRLESQYHEVVDKPPSPDRTSGGVSDLLGPGYSDPYDPLSPSSSLDPSSPLERSIVDAAMPPEEAQTLSDPLDGIGFEVNNSVLGLNSQEKQKLEEAQQDLRDIEIEIKTLQQRKGRLEREKERLQPKDLNSTLYANVATIILSVVVPIGAYLGTVTEFTVSELAWVQTWMIAVSWLLGLFIVFGAIYIRINNDD
jgi:hypothetical protein